MFVRKAKFKAALIRSFHIFGDGMTMALIRPGITNIRLIVTEDTSGHIFMKGVNTRITQDAG